jgi:regulatory protein
MKITGIKQQVKNAERVSVFVDGKYSFSLTLDELLEHKLANGLELDEPRLAKFKKLSADGKLRARALEWVLNRPRSIREFTQYMHRKKAEPELTEKLIAEFTSKGYLDEEKFASWLVELRVSSGKSNRAIAAELASKGIDRELSSSALEGEAGSEKQRLDKLVAQKSKLSRYADPQKLMRYLASKGFGYDLIKESLDQDLDH